jgi:hypothetical protein
MDLGRAENPEQLVGDAQIHRVVAEIVAGLDEPFRQTIVRRFFEGESSAEIARRLRIPEGTVRWRLKEGLDRVRRQLDARHGDNRKEWMAALSPLLPTPFAHKSSAGDSPPAGRAAARTPGSSRIGPMLAALAAMAGLVTGVIAVQSRPSRQSSIAAPSSSEEPLKGQDEPRAGTTVRFNLPFVASPEPVRDPSLGPGAVDAQSLVEELLGALRADAYDDFVAKGSATVRAKLSPAEFHAASGQLAGRLGQSYGTSLLGQLQRPNHVDWLFKLAFANGGDDALVTLSMQAWQVAGFWVDAGLPPTTEK